jgi:hypothetical protein
VRKVGADATIDYKKSPEDQLADLMKTTGSKFSRIFDAVGLNDSFARLVFKVLKLGFKYFSTTNDLFVLCFLNKGISCSKHPFSSGIQDFEGGKTYTIALGPIGRDEGKELNEDLKKFIPFIHQLVEDGKIVPNEYDVVGEGGMDSVLEAITYQQKGAGGSNKVIVKIQDK